MNIRHHIKRRLAWGASGAIASWLLLVIVVAITGGDPPVPVMLALMGTFMIAIIFLNFAIRCLLCGGNLGIIVVPAMYSFFGKKRRISFCAYCGASLDATIDPARQAAARDRAEKRGA